MTERPKADAMGVAAITLAAKEAIRAAAVLTIIDGHPPVVSGSIPHLPAPALDRLARMGSSEVTADSPKPLSSDEHLAMVLKKGGFVRALVRPIQMADRRLGTIVAFGRSPEPFTESALLEIFALHIATAVMVAGSSTAVGQSEHLANMEALDRLALSANTIAELCYGLNEYIAPLFNAAVTGVMVWDEALEVLQMLEGSFGATAAVAASYRISIRDARSNAARVFSTGQPYLSNDAHHDPGILPQWTSAFAVDRIISVPLWYDERVIGVMHLANKRSDFRVEDVQRAEALGRRVAALLEYAWSMFRVRRAKELESVLLRIAIGIASDESIHSFLPAALEELRLAMGAEVISLRIDGSPPIVARVDSIPAPFEEMGFTVPDEAGAELTTTVSTPREVGDPGWVSAHGGVMFGGRRVGAISAYRLRAEPFALDEIRSIERLGSLAALAYASDQYHQQRAELARIEERDRLADDLHDDVAQLLFGAQMSLDLALERPETSGSLRSQLARANSLVVKADGALRSLIMQWSRSASGSLQERLVDTIREVQDIFGLEAQLNLSDAAASESDDASDGATELLQRVAREALVNTAKHAGPCSVIVTLTAPEPRLLMLTVEDDGAGESERREASGHGLESLRRAMESQGGRLSTHGGVDGGFRVAAELRI